MLASFRTDSSWISDRASRLLSADCGDYQGDHGFEGEAYEAWKKQRLTYLSLLLEILDGALSRETYNAATNTLCPRDVARYALTPAQRELGDDRYIPGTNAGAMWASRCFNLAHDARLYGTIAQAEYEVASGPDNDGVYAGDEDFGYAEWHTGFCTPIPHEPPTKFLGEHIASRRNCDYARGRYQSGNTAVYHNVDCAKIYSDSLYLDHPGDHIPGARTCEVIQRAKALGAF